MSEKDPNPAKVEPTEYESPTITDYGDLRELTRGSTGTPKVDKTFTTGQTPTSFLSH